MILRSLVRAVTVKVLVHVKIHCGALILLLVDGVEPRRDEGVPFSAPVSLRNLNLTHKNLQVHALTIQLHNILRVV